MTIQQASYEVTMLAWYQVCSIKFSCCIPSGALLCDIQNSRIPAENCKQDKQGQILDSGLVIERNLCERASGRARASPSSRCISYVIGGKPYEVRRMSGHVALRSASLCNTIGTYISCRLQQRLISTSVLQHSLWKPFTNRPFEYCAKIQSSVSLLAQRTNCGRSFTGSSLYGAGLRSSIEYEGTIATRYVSPWEKKLSIRHFALDRRKDSSSLLGLGRRLEHTRSNGKDIDIVGARAEERPASTRPNASELTGSRSKEEYAGKHPESDKPGAPKNDSSSPLGNVHLLDRLPNMPSIARPSKEELLAAATGFWSRLKVRFKWFSIRSARPFNADEIGAFFSWILVGHVLWIILGTTTFFSLAIFAVNTVFAQETLARWVGNYLTKSSGIKVVFESAIVPKWGDGVITFKNVFVSRRPGQGRGRVSKGSPETAAAAAAATAVAGQSRENGNFSQVQEEEDTNYTQFDVSLETVNVTLSFTKWFNSKGLLQNVEIKGVRGVVDRTNVHYPEHYVDPRSYKHEHNPGDFEIDSFKMEDLLVTIHQPHGFRPFSVSIFSCDLPRLRRQWLFYDFLSANMMSGSFDESLFTIHPRQMHGLTGSQVLQENDTNGVSPWKKHSRIRIDGLNIDHLNRGVEGPFSWIHKGNVDIVADIMFPVDNDESIVKVVSDLYDRVEATVISRQQARHEESPVTIVHDEANGPASKEDLIHLSNKDEDKRFLVMDLRLHLNDIKAAVPIFTRHISYVSNALIRPIVAYMNSQSTFIPINCRVVKCVDEFDGSWTIFDSGLMDDLSAEVNTETSRHEGHAN